MAPNTTFRSLNFNPIIGNDSLNDKSQDPDVNFFRDNVSHITPSLLYSKLVHILMIFSRAIVVKNESTWSLSMKGLLS